MQHCLILGGGLSGKAAERLAVSLGFSAAVLSDSPGLDADAAVAPADLVVTLRCAARRGESANF